MELLKKITTCVISLTLVITSADALATSRWPRNQEEVSVEAQPEEGQQQPQKPKPQQQNGEAVAVQEEAAEPAQENASQSEEVKRSCQIRQCCSMIMEEAQKLDNCSVAEDICQMVAMVQMQEMQEKIAQRCACNKPKPQQQPQPQQIVQQQNVASAEADQAAQEKMSTKEMLRECCSALMQCANENCDCHMNDRINEIMAIVEKVDTAC